MASKGKQQKTMEDYKERLRLKELIYGPRVVRQLSEYKQTSKTTFIGEQGETKTMSLKDLEEELKASEIGQLLLRRGLLIVPVVDYI